MMDSVSVFFFIFLLGLIFFFYDDIHDWIDQNRILFRDKEKEEPIISPHKKLLSFWKSKIPKSMWSFLYYSSVWDEPYFFVRVFGIGIVLGHIVLSSYLNQALSFCFGIVVSIGFVLAIMKARTINNRTMFSQSFPLAVNLMHDAIKSGLSLKQSLEVIVHESKGPVKKVFANILHGLEAGIPTETILELEKQNVNHEEFSLLCSALVINDMTGGTLEMMLSKIQMILINRKEFQQKMKVSIASTKADGWIVTLVTLFILVFILYANSRAYNFFMYEPQGHKLLKILVGLFVCNVLSTFIITHTIRSK